MKTKTQNAKPETQRCPWCGTDPLYTRYHDEEWARPITDNIGLYERMCLEGFQAGLSWITILKKRENFRTAFAGFDYEKVAHFTKADVERLLQNDGIIRHRGKIEATIHNARHIPLLIEEFGSLHRYFLKFKPENTKMPRISQDIPAKTAESEELSKDLRRRGFKFVGPTTLYALMQATGLVNDHLESCTLRNLVEEERRHAMLV
ncbi:MAG: DNA-3-methyladenine glycosylase I [Alphaproteobacteria bacterium]|nr:DNA-3-methyladenine glycosylase I [Alphaproteobacteria bacterium]